MLSTSFVYIISQNLHKNSAITYSGEAQPSRREYPPKVKRPPASGDSAVVHCRGRCACAPSAADWQLKTGTLRYRSVLSDSSLRRLCPKPELIVKKRGTACTWPLLAGRLEIESARGYWLTAFFGGSTVSPGSDFPVSLSQSSSAYGFQHSAYSRHLAQRCSTLSGDCRSVDFAPLS